MIFTPLFVSESDENSNYEGSKQEEIDALRLRDHFDGHFDCDSGSEVDMDSELCSALFQSTNRVMSTPVQLYTEIKTRV